MIRVAFERFLRRRWRGPALRLRYWDGREVTVGAPPPLLTLHVKSPSALRGIARNPSLGFGRAYMDGLIVVEGDLLAFLNGAFAIIQGWEYPWFLQRPRWLTQFRPASPSQAEANARFHYDRGNEFFKLWLDSSLTYSCAYFRNERDDLETAQEQKRELICRKLDLQPGMTLLDVGCGWGSLLFHAIERYGVRGVGINPSREQARYMTEEGRRRGLADRLTLHVADWRAIGGTYDRVVSVGMVEHVGRTLGRQFHEKWADWLKPDGVSVLHTIGAMTSTPPDPWITENIFPGAYLPSLTELSAHAAAAGLVVTDVENLWRHYALTLAAWRRNFAAHRAEIVRLTSEAFTRRWWLYLNASEASFRTGRILLWQLVLTKGKRGDQPLTREGWDVRSPHN